MFQAFSWKAHLNSEGKFFIYDQGLIKPENKLVKDVSFPSPLKLLRQQLVQKSHSVFMSFNQTLEKYMNTKPPSYAVHSPSC
jgi:hypothetical protein